MSNRNRVIAAIAVNAIVVVLEVVAITYGLVTRGFAETFMYYTDCSNLFGGIVCAVCLYAEARQLRGGPAISKRLRWWKFAAACCLLMTFMVVVLVLAPMIELSGGQGYYRLLCTQAMPITHLTGPLLVFFSYAIFEADPDMTVRQSLVGIVFTVIYAAVAYACNIARVWEGPYPFFEVWNMPAWMSVLWFVALCLLAFALCQLPRLLGRRLAARRAGA